MTEDFEDRRDELETEFLAVDSFFGRRRGAILRGMHKLSQYDPAARLKLVVLWGNLERLEAIQSECRRRGWDSEDVVQALAEAMVYFNLALKWQGFGAERTIH